MKEMEGKKGKNGMMGHPFCGPDELLNHSSDGEEYCDEPSSDDFIMTRVFVYLTHIV